MLGPFVRNAWYVAAWSTEVPAGQPFARQILGERLVMFRDSRGGIAVVEDRCCHRGLPLSLGHIVADTIVCGYHGISYNAAGRCVAIPGQRHVPPAMRVRSYPVVERDELIWVWMGAGEEADTALVPSYPYHDDRARWPHRTHWQVLRCAHTLVIDNLLDLTHLAFVHKRTIGGDPDAHTNAEFLVEATPRGVRLMRWLLDSMPPPTYVNAVGFKGRVDRWMEFEFIAPGAVLQFTGALDVGQGAYERGNREGGFALRIFHGITPETADTCHYFWSGCHGYRQSEAAVTDQLYTVLAATFAEDAAILEAQHVSVRSRPAPLFSTTHDRARVIAERKLQELLAAEAGTAHTVGG
ncbi:MAG TPA: aromatic ring-hydroxylating dioxygenase subunit alpha [Steroidobacteraceae bacterium]|nr:aromatic ring-hydroxylating dioxygenase subunit alpha [Steroidobacteraceae bacterium]